jgi:hypothetical protein
MHSIVRVGDPDKGLARLGRQQEIIFDMGWNVGQHMAELGVKQADLCDRLMDRIEGSRGLFFEHVMKWVGEFDKDWESRGAKDKENYLEDIDNFVKAKFEALVATVPAVEATRKVVSIQVVPVIEDNGNVTPQFEGPTSHTTSWGVYERSEAGTANWVADVADEDKAMFFGEQLAAYHEVKIEPQPWRSKA